MKDWNTKEKSANQYSLIHVEFFLIVKILRQDYEVSLNKIESFSQSLYDNLVNSNDTDDRKIIRIDVVTGVCYFEESIKAGIYIDLSAVKEKINNFFIPKEASQLNLNLNTISEKN